MDNTFNNKENNYKEVAKQARIKVLEMIHKAGTSHIGSNFSIIDVATVLYDKADLTKDRIIWSKGWAAATAYYFLAKKGVIPEDDLDTFCQPGSNYIGLAEPTVKGIDFAGGSMGMGLPAGVGYALSKKMKGEDGTVYVIMSDGELAIGTTWESALIAGHHHLDNLVVIIDSNGFQAMGRTEDVLSSGFPAIYGEGWSYDRIDGHNFKEIEAHLRLRGQNCPRVVNATTTKGKGVSFMENLLDWHYKNVDEVDYQRALKELNYAKNN